MSKWNDRTAARAKARRALEATMTDRPGMTDYAQTLSGEDLNTARANLIALLAFDVPRRADKMREMMLDIVETEIKRREEVPIVEMSQ